MEIIPEIISSEKVKPSSPTPHHLKTYKLSMLDQFTMRTLVPLVFYFLPNTADHDLIASEKTQLLKRSLSVILTRFYPLAGRFKKDNVASIDCNDEGVPFVVARIKGGHKLSDLLGNINQDYPQLILMSSRMLPCEVTFDGSEMGLNDRTVAMIQINHFDCGGIAVSAVFSHAVVDAATIANFLKSWAQTTTTTTTTPPICPNYIFSSLFPQKQGLTKQDPDPSGFSFKFGKSVMTRYVFDWSTISKLKGDVSGFNVERPPSRVEVVSALIWKCFMVASLANNKPLSRVFQIVNMRRRAQPPFPSDCFGNFIGSTPATSINTKEMELGQLVTNIRDAVSRVDHDFVNRLHGDEGFSGFCRNLELTWAHQFDPEEVDDLFITSWCGFGFYGIDFGWGNPVWLTKCDTGSTDDSNSAFLNCVGLMETRLGDGIEAWVVLDEKYMPIFDSVLSSYVPIIHNPIAVPSYI